MRWSLACALGLGVGGCISITSVNIGQKTTLERQLIGELEPFTEEELLASSVRAGAGSGSVALDDLRQRAVAARRRQLFNRDDLDELRALGCVGEARGAVLVIRPCDAEADPEVVARRDRLVGEENEDRATIIEWAIATDPVLTNTDRDQVAQVYTRVLHERVGLGQWIQLEDGSWVRKSGDS